VQLVVQFGRRKRFEIVRSWTPTLNCVCRFGVRASLAFAHPRRFLLHGIGDVNRFGNTIVSSIA
jgi:hypothetical protein